MSIDPAAAHLAVRRRNQAFDGLFVYGVVTTSIYCRPSCPSRPKAEHLRFFATGHEAAAQGFRPCRRCRPEL